MAKVGLNTLPPATVGGVNFGKPIASSSRQISARVSALKAIRRPGTLRHWPSAFGTEAQMMPLLLPWAESERKAPGMPSGERTLLVACGVVDTRWVALS